MVVEVVHLQSGVVECWSIGVMGWTSLDSPTLKALRRAGSVMTKGLPAGPTGHISRIGPIRPVRPLRESGVFRDCAKI
jgi:hypothetical protein